MPGELNNFYFDANVFLAYISDEGDRAGIIEELLRKAQARELAIMTSTMSVAEVAYGAQEKLQGSLDSEVEARIDALWSPGGPVTLVEASRRLLVTARGLIRANLASGHGRLTPLDAVHLATAQIEKADALYTYESNKCERWAALTGLVVSEPMLTQPKLDLGRQPGDRP